MIKILFICHGRPRTFGWRGLKSRLLRNENGICDERSSYGVGFFSFTKKCRFECRLSVGCLYGTVAFAVVRWKLISMNITMRRNVIKMFRIVIRIIISSDICIKIDKNERNKLMIDCNTYYVVVLLIIIVYLT